MSWLRQVLTGPDNQTVAIGRLVGLAVAVVLLIGLPVTAAGTVIAGKVEVAVWRALFDALGLYVPPLLVALGAFIWGTNKTEPMPPAPRDGAAQ